MDLWIFNEKAAKPDYVVGYGSDGEQQFAHLRLPSGDAPHPVIVFIHGGYYRARYGLDYAEHACVALTDAGFATYNIEYRRVGSGGGFPTTFQDLAAALDFLPRIAMEYNLDTDRVITMGHSAGGHLALWLAGRQRIAENSELYAAAPLKIRGAVALAGVNDLIKGHELGLSDNIIDTLLGGAPDKFADRYAAVSPMQMLPLGVPQWVIHGTADDAVPYLLSESYAARAAQLGDTVKLITLPDAGHFEVVDPRSSEWAQVVAAAHEAAG
jgi:acetyl esterase/lipase